MYCMNILSCIAFYRWLVLHTDVSIYLWLFKVMSLLKSFQIHRIFNNKKRVVMVMITYSLAMSTVLSSPPLLGWGHFAPEENGMR